MPQEQDANLVDPSEEPGQDVDPSEEQPAGGPSAALQQPDDTGEDGDGPNR